MNNRLWCVTALFNPVGFQSRLENYFLFRDRLQNQHINLLTVEVAFRDQEFTLPEGPNVRRLRSQSVLWQKERALNYAISQLPAECDRVAWLDADLLFPYGWDDFLIETLEQVHFVQLYEKLIHLRPGDRTYGGYRVYTWPGIVLQAIIYGKNWIPLRSQEKLPYAAMGAAWAARRSSLGSGLYERFILGGGDTVFADALLNSEAIHQRFYSRLTSWQKSDLVEWRKRFSQNRLTVAYLPIDVYHLWHGSTQDRGYDTREFILQQHQFDPQNDLTVSNDVLEWKTHKPGFQEDVVRYFQSRKEDS